MALNIRLLELELSGLRQPYSPSMEQRGKPNRQSLQKGRLDLFESRGRVIATVMQQKHKQKIVGVLRKVNV